MSIGGKVALFLGGTLLGSAGFKILAPAASALLHNASTILLSMDCLTELLPDDHVRRSDEEGARNP
ncbi:MAG: hypothetical protein IKQ27_12415 [Lachnospiraceae bacterium]|nr:hypothetical protein [Lachnospiraceae bacterium]